VDSGYYAACAGLRAKSQALEVVANNVANLNSTGYASAQVDKKKIGQLAVAIQTAFQQMGVFPGTGTGVPISSGANEPLTDNQKPGGNRIVYQDKLLPAVQEEEDISELIPELKRSLGPELLRNEVALRTEIDGLVISLREIGLYETGSPQIHLFQPSVASHPYCRITVAGSGSRATPTMFPSTTAIQRQLGTVNRACDGTGSFANYRIWLRARTTLCRRLRAILTRTLSLQRSRAEQIF